jgi:hypothetical protein
MGKGMDAGKITFEDFKAAVCNVCEWHSVPVSERFAKKLGVHHVILDHPDTYTAITGKMPPSVDILDQFELGCFTDS